MTDEKLLELCREMTAEVPDEDYYQRCPTCDGSGFINGWEECPDCDGGGWIEI